MRHPPTRRGGPAMFALIGRALVSYALVAAVTGYFFRVKYNFRQDVVAPYFDRLLDLAAQLDVFHTLFYAFFAYFLVGLIPPRLGRRIGWIAALPLSAVSGLLPAVAPYATRPVHVFHPLFYVLCLALAVNAFFLLRGAPERGWRLAAVTWFARVPVVTDAFFPAVVWAHYRRVTERPLRLFRLGAVLLPPLLIVGLWVVRPLPVAADVIVSPILHNLAPGSFHQLLVDPRDESVTAVDAIRQQLARFFARPAPDAVPTVAPLRRQLPLRGVGVDFAANRLLAIDPADETATISRADTLAVVRRDALTLPPTTGPGSVPSANQNSPGHTGPCRTYSFGLGRPVYSFCEEGLISFCPDAVTPLAQLWVSPGDILYDEVNDRLVLLGWFERVRYLDPRSLQTVGGAPKPYLAERGVIDAPHNRVLFAVSQTGRLYGHDLTTGAAVGTWRGFLGMRTPVLAQRRNWILIGGLSPVFEIRTWPDWSLVARLNAPPWLRHVVLDADENTVYFSTGGHGLWWLDADEVAAYGRRRFWQRYDPFYAFVDVAATVVRKLIGLDQWQFFGWGERQPSPLSDGACPPGNWQD